MTKYTDFFDKMSVAILKFVKKLFRGFREISREIYADKIWGNFLIGFQIVVNLRADYSRRVQEKPCST